ncbi:MAG: hypothetical protein LH649_04730 [Pseudanabaena sp. CAN_BIN31]|nr:hypothetical protein [Pseudanabaena sp. CAN_BIN31]
MLQQSLNCNKPKADEVPIASNIISIKKRSPLHKRNSDRHTEQLKIPC